MCVICEHNDTYWLLDRSMFKYNAIMPTPRGTCNNARCKCLSMDILQHITSTSAAYSVYALCNPMSAMDKHVDAQLDGCTTAGRRCPHNRCAPELFEGRLSTSPSQCDTWIVLDLGHRVEAASIAPKKLIWRQQRAYVIHHATVRARPVQLVASDPI